MMSSGAPDTNAALNPAVFALEAVASAEVLRGFAGKGQIAPFKKYALADPKCGPFAGPIIGLGRKRDVCFEFHPLCLPHVYPHVHPPLGSPSAPGYGPPKGALPWGREFGVSPKGLHVNGWQLGCLILAIFAGGGWCAAFISSSKLDKLLDEKKCGWVRRGERGRFVRQM